MAVTPQQILDERAKELTTELEREEIRIDKTLTANYRSNNEPVRVSPTTVDPRWTPAFKESLYVALIEKYESHWNVRVVGNSWLFTSKAQDQKTVKDYLEK